MPALTSPEDRLRLRDEVFGTTRERMLREITDALDALTVETPIVFALEDLHWSDASTIDLLSSIAGRSGPARLMILATYRPDEIAAEGHPLKRVHYELQVHRQCHALPLSYWTEQDIGEYLRARFPEPDSYAAAAAPLYRRTNGNPLYIVCLADELVRSGNIHSDPETIRQLVPDTLQQMFERQASGLSEDEQDVVDTAAAAGELFSTATVAAALGRCRAETESLCERLVRRQTILKRADVVRFPDGAESARYSFLHALCRDALYRRLPHGRRSRLHGLVGHAEEQLYASDPTHVAVELAGHFELAGEFPLAIRYLRLAADGAAARFSNEEAARHLENAFRLLERSPDTERASLHMDLLEQRARMHMARTEWAIAVEDYEILADMARASGNVERTIKALLDCVLPLMILDQKRALAIVKQARELRFGADPVLVALVDLFGAPAEGFFSGWTPELGQVIRETHPRSNIMSDPLLRSRVLWIESMARILVDDYPSACRAAEESRIYARKAGAFFDYFVATLFLIWGRMHRGDLGGALRIAREDAALAARNNNLFAKTYLEIRQAWVAMEAFDFETALPICERVAREPAMANVQSIFPVLLWLGMARLGTKDYRGAWDAIESLTVAMDGGAAPLPHRLLFFQTRAECAFGRGDLAQAKILADQNVRMAHEHRVGSYVARGRRLLAEIALEEGDDALAGEQITQAAAALKGCEALNVEWQVYATAAHIFARLGRDRGVRAGAAAQFRIATRCSGDARRRAGSPPILAQPGQPGTGQSSLGLNRLPASFRPIHDAQPHLDTLLRCRNNLLSTKGSAVSTASLP